MSSWVAVAVVIATAAVVALILLAIYRWRVRLPGSDWYEHAGEQFARDLQARRRRYLAAREDAEQLSTALTEHLQAAVAASASTSLEIASAVASDCEAALRDLLLRLDARERGLSQLTVVLYGRTKAGKSSLYYVLSGEGYEANGIGDGRQNFTRETYMRTLATWS